jgi:ubiquinone/menaquinone biosynthesis C-methylase UbiE
MSDRYTHGHHESVLRAHRWRTVENSAAYLLPHLAPGQRLLDVGCGPGTITLDLAGRVAPGDVVGIDVAADVVAAAEADRARAGVERVRYAVGDVYALADEDASYDVVHAHQVLQHLSDPVRALRELRRVLRPGGLLAVRDGDYGGFVWSPPDPRLTRWNDLYHQVTTHNGSEADAGRLLPAWVRAAGFDDVRMTSSTWTFADPGTRAWWGDLWAERVAAPGSAFAGQAVAYGLADASELQDLAAGWRDWAAADDAVLIIPHGEVLATR